VSSIQSLSCGLLLAAFVAGCSPDPAAVTIDPCLNQPSGSACTWLGASGETGFNGDGQKRWDTRINQVQDLLFLPDGSAWFTDFNNFLVRKVMPDDTVKSVVGWTDPVFPGDGPIGGVPSGGAEGAEWQLNHPTNLTLAPDGNVIVVAWHNHKLLTVEPDTGWVRVVCGAGAGFAGDGGPASAALFKQPNDVTVDEDSNLYIVDQQNQRIRRIDPQGIIETVAGTGVYGSTRDGAAALDAEFSWAFGSNPNPSGGIVYHDRHLYVADTEAHRIRVIDLDTGNIAALAGTGEPGFSGDGGPAASAQLSAPRDLEIGPDGDLYIADTDNGAVRAVNLSTNVIRTVVGTGELGADDEQLPATQSRLRRPFGIAFDPDGNLFVMDSLNERVVKVAR
jgi:sugar lactone lactonase YvrE